jgi:Carboxypeptidase regulatory-like domain
MDSTARNIMNSLLFALLTLILTACPSAPAPTAKPSFLIDLFPSAFAIEPGKSQGFELSVAAKDGFSGTVALSMAGLPQGMDFSPKQITVLGDGIQKKLLTLTAAPNTMTGSYNLTLNASQGTLSQSSMLMVNVKAPPKVLEVALTGDNKVKSGSSIPLRVGVTGTGDFDKGVFLSVTMGSIIGSAKDSESVSYTAPNITTATTATINITSRGDPTIKSIFIVNITPSITGLVISGGTEVASEGTITLSASVTGGDSSLVNWTVTGGTPTLGTGSSITIKAPKIEEGGPNSTITVKATSVQDSTISATATITVKAPQITTGSLGGTVKDNNGPLAGVRVMLSNGQDTITGLDGKYLFGKISAGLYNLNLFKSGYDMQNVFATVEAGKTITRDVTLTKTPALR